MSVKRQPYFPKSTNLHSYTFPPFYLFNVLIICHPHLVTILPYLSIKQSQPPNLFPFPHSVFLETTEWNTQSHIHKKDDHFICLACMCLNQFGLLIRQVQINACEKASGTRNKKDYLKNISNKFGKLSKIFSPSSCFSHSRSNFSLCNPQIFELKPNLSCSYKVSSSSHCISSFIQVFISSKRSLKFCNPLRSVSYFSFVSHFLFPFITFLSFFRFSCLCCCLSHLCLLSQNHPKSIDLNYYTEGADFLKVNIGSKKSDFPPNLSTSLRIFWATTNMFSCCPLLQEVTVTNSNGQLLLSIGSGGGKARSMSFTGGKKEIMNEIHHHPYFGAEGDLQNFFFTRKSDPLPFSGSPKDQKHAQDSKSIYSCKLLNDRGHLFLPLLLLQQLLLPTMTSFLLLRIVVKVSFLLLLLLLMIMLLQRPPLMKMTIKEKREKKAKRCVLVGSCLALSWIIFVFFWGGKLHSPLFTLGRSLFFEINLGSRKKNGCGRMSIFHIREKRR
ncbi:hypothetical protein VP01_2959g2 [Puccinia sorghi]|uniref:Uncharacterized protein n=1 Tax=Puccinia sorghi TaxID=27349 RepID=A0A0L6V0Y3_9BASI|nr:hypothetical protein VP01_2959g2 [Puccinia sorghi]